MKGRVVSIKMKNTVVVLIERMAMHPLYKKTYAQSKKYLVDTDMALKEGDIVEIVKVKPVSKNKHWKVAKVVGKDLAAIVKAKQKETAEAAIAEVMPEEKKEVPSDEGKVISQKTEDKKLKKEEKTKK
ncbi:MAG: 30S ribosomal protein S17 [Candidatus Daviesbacteria bacterium]|nr:30S ribosomal protein S17 [Candidatus Daviesbacteria bacterium]